MDRIPSFQPKRYSGMKKILNRHQLLYFIILIFSLSSNINAQTPKQIIATVNSKFAKVKDYSSDVSILCDIPFIKINSVNAKVYFQKPNHFKIKSEGILILPKQSPDFLLATLADTNAYTAVQTAVETYRTTSCNVINIIPNSDTADLVLGKFWIDASKGLVMKSQLTTKVNGTILIESFYGSQSAYGLPDKLLFTIDVKKFKIPKALLADINQTSTTSNNDSQQGKITINFSNYAINKGIDSSIFK